MKSLYAKLDTLLLWKAKLLRSPFLLILRLYFGWQFCQAGWGKLMNLQRTADFFAGIQIPAPMVNAFAAGFVECVGGALLALGLASRLVSVPLIVTMVVAYLTAHRTELQGIFSATDKFLAAPPFLFLLASLIVFIFGPGKFSADQLLLKQDEKN